MRRRPRIQFQLLQIRDCGQILDKCQLSKLYWFFGVIPFLSDKTRFEHTQFMSVRFCSKKEVPSLFRYKKQPGNSVVFGRNGRMHKNWLFGPFLSCWRVVRKRKLLLCPPAFNLKIYANVENLFWKFRQKECVCFGKICSPCETTKST